MLLCFPDKNHLRSSKLYPYMHLMINQIHNLVQRKRRGSNQIQRSRFFYVFLKRLKTQEKSWPLNLNIQRLRSPLAHRRGSMLRKKFGSELLERSNNPDFSMFFEKEKAKKHEKSGLLYMSIQRLKSPPARVVEKVWIPFRVQSILSVRGYLSRWMLKSKGPNFFSCFSKKKSWKYNRTYIIWKINIYSTYVCANEYILLLKEILLTKKTDQDHKVLNDK